MVIKTLNSLKGKFCRKSLISGRQFVQQSWTWNVKLYKQETISPAFLGGWRKKEKKKKEKKKKEKSLPLFSRGVNFVIKLWLTPHKYTAALVLPKDRSDYFF